MILLRGKRKGQTATIHQYCNDWISVDYADGSTGIVGLTGVQLDPAEVARIRSAADVGMMWQEFDLSDDGRFTRKPQLEVFLTELSGGPLDGAHWIYNYTGDVATLDPSVTWTARPEPQTWPLPDTIPVSSPHGYYVKESESQMPPQTSRRSRVVRGAFYVWKDES